jgi:hypothetical protein
MESGVPTMSGVSRRSLPSWREAATANGFGVLCVKSEKGEWFTVSMVNETKAAVLANVGLHPGAMVSEADLLKKLGLTQMPEADAHAWIRLSRDWATTFTHSRKRDY